MPVTPYYTIANPISRDEIRKFTQLLRRKAGAEKSLYFPVMQFLEWFMPQIDKDFSLEILPSSEMGNCHGKTYPIDHKIFLREDVYERACNDVGRDRFTVSHEIGHYLMHKPNNVQYARMENPKIIPAYMNPEWQANTFAGELLVPHHLIAKMDCSTIVEKCAVSYQVAQIQKSQF